MTAGEQKFWTELRELKKLGLHVRKQVPIGKYIADFAILKKKLIIEVDGEYHFEASQKDHDRRRDTWLISQGYKVLRFTTADIDDATEGCVEEIMRQAGVL